MKNIRISIWFIATFLIFLTGCKKDTLVKPIAFSETIDLTDLRKVSQLTDEFGIYTEQFKLHHGNVNIRSTVHDFFNENTYSGRITAWAFDDIEADQLLSIDGGDYFVNNLQLKYNGNNYSLGEFGIGNNGAEPTNDFIRNEVVGKEINIKNMLDGELIFDEIFYVPAAIYLEGISDNRIPETNLIRMNRNDLTIDYNQDTGNENGILITMTFRGGNYNMDLEDFENTTSENIRRAVHIKSEPTGSITIPGSLFDGIPAGGIATVYVGRGNGKLIKHQGKESYINAFTQQQFFIVLD